MKFHECLPVWIDGCIQGADVREIRLRNGAFVRVNVGGRWYYCSSEGLTRHPGQSKLLDVSCNEIVQKACNRSIYAYESMLASGYFTLEDGARFGVAGSYSQDGQVFKEYTSICIRVPHCVSCISEGELSAVAQSNTLIIGAPGCGKTTLLRDVASKLAQDNNVVVVDERGELDIREALRDCDVLKWTSKNVGVEMALRCLSPNYIVCDELAPADFSWISRATSAGVKVIATLHASSIDEVNQVFDLSKNFKNTIICKSVGRYQYVNS